MKIVSRLAHVTALALVCLITAAPLSARAGDQVQAAPTPPTTLTMTGTLILPGGEPRTGDVLLVASLYAAQNDPTPLWSEEHLVTLTAQGGYTITVGGTQADGIPRNYFADGSARWVGIGAQGEQEQPRVMILAVPYALKAGDAAALAGVPSTEFVQTTELRESLQTVTDTLESVVTRGGGSGPGTLATQDVVAKFTGVGNELADSNIFDVGGNVGIGTTAPNNSLDVMGSLQVTRAGVPSQFFTITPAVGGSETYFRNTGSGGGFLFRNVANNSTIMSLADSGAVTMTNGLNITAGNVGIGTAAPQDPLDVHGGFRVTRLGVPTQYFSIAPGVGGAETYFRNTGTAGGFLFRNVLDNSTIMTLADSGLVTVTNGLNVTSGSVGIGTATPASPLDVHGTLRVTRAGVASQYFTLTPAVSGSDTVFRNVGVSGGFLFRNAADSATILHLEDSGQVSMLSAAIAGNATVNGNVTVAGNIAAKYQDVAEWVESGTPLENGTIVIVDPAHNDHVIPSTVAYDTRIAGAVSPQPGLLLGDASDTKSKVAQSGRVRVKVDASYGAVKIGDLLVTSPTPGHAMKSKPVRIGKESFHRPGTLLGKALEALPNGKGEILVLLTLQ